MNIIIFLNSLFLKPSTYMIAFYVYVKLIKHYKSELKSDINNANLTDWEIFGKANAKVSSSAEEVTSFCEIVSEQLGIFKYIISLLFWIGIYNLIF